MHYRAQYKVNSVNEIEIRNISYYFFNDMLNIKNLDPSKIKIYEKSCKNILIDYVAYVALYSVRPLYLIINKMNEYIEECNGNKCLTLVPTDESKDTGKKYQELWSKIGDLIRSITNNSDNYDEKYMNIKLNLLFPSKLMALHLPKTTSFHQQSSEARKNKLPPL